MVYIPVRFLCQEQWVLLGLTGEGVLLGLARMGHRLLGQDIDLKIQAEIVVLSSIRLIGGDSLRIPCVSLIIRRPRIITSSDVRAHHLPRLL